MVGVVGSSPIAPTKISSLRQEAIHRMFGQTSNMFSTQQPARVQHLSANSQPLDGVELISM